jgi:hypothetical protein
VCSRIPLHNILLREASIHGDLSDIIVLLAAVQYTATHRCYASSSYIPSAAAVASLLCYDEQSYSTNHRIERTYVGIEIFIRRTRNKVRDREYTSIKSVIQISRRSFTEKSIRMNYEHQNQENKASGAMCGENKQQHLLHLMSAVSAVLFQATRLTAGGLDPNCPRAMLCLFHRCE